MRAPIATNACNVTRWPFVMPVGSIGIWAHCNTLFTNQYEGSRTSAGNFREAAFMSWLVWCLHDTRPIPNLPAAAQSFSPLLACQKRLLAAWIHVVFALSQDVVSSSGRFGACMQRHLSSYQ